jgi:hypothetical protein
MALPAVVLVGLGAVGLYELFKKKDAAVQTLTVHGDDDGAPPAQVAVPVTDDAPTPSQTDVPPTSDEVSETPTDQDLGTNVVVETGPSGPRFRHHHRRFIPPPIVPGTVPLAPAIVTPFGPSPLNVRTPHEIQLALNALGYRVPVDGRMGPEAQAAILRFQHDHGLPMLGWREETRFHLQNALQRRIPRFEGLRDERGMHVHGESDCPFGAEPVVTTATPGTPTKVAAATGTPPIETPHAVQIALNKIGSNPPLKVDGDIGPKTVAATKAFQIAAGLLPDGVPGPKTRTALALAACPPERRRCVITPWVDPWPIKGIPRSPKEQFLHWADTHHLRATGPIPRHYHPGPMPCITPSFIGPVMISRNEKFDHWGRAHHLQSPVDEIQSPFGTVGGGRRGGHSGGRGSARAPQTATATTSRMPVQSAARAAAQPPPPPSAGFSKGQGAPPPAPPTGQTSAPVFNATAQGLLPGGSSGGYGGGGYGGGMQSSMPYAGGGFMNPYHSNLNPGGGPAGEVLNGIYFGYDSQRPFGCDPGAVPFTFGGSTHRHRHAKFG